MARKLPWLATKSSKVQTNGSDKDTSSKKRRRTETADRAGEYDNDHGGRGGGEHDSRAQRYGSSSPPPAPPKEVFMLDGNDADDGWRLVEDEFEMTARLFTRHLHHAEYRRQKQLAKTRNQGAADSITRSADLNTAMRSPHSNDSEGKNDGKAGKFFKNVKDDDPWLSDPRLAGLMSSKGTQDSHSKIKALHSSSRAAHGFSKGQVSPPKRRAYASMLRMNTERDASERATPSDDEAVNSDDLDGPASSLVVARSLSRVQVERNTGQGNFMSSIEKAAVLRSGNVSKSDNGNADNGDEEEDDDDDNDIFDLLTSSKHLDKAKVVKHQPIHNNKGNDDTTTRKRQLGTDEIPTFLV